MKSTTTTTVSDLIAASLKWFNGAHVDPSPYKNKKRPKRKQPTDSMKNKVVQMTGLLHAHRFLTLTTGTRPLDATIDPKLLTVRKCDSCTVDSSYTRSLNRCTR